MPSTNLIPQKKPTAPARTGLNSPSLGGSITMNGKATRYAPTPAKSPDMNAGGTMTRGGQATTVAPSMRTGLTPPAAARPNKGGTITMNGQTRTYPGSAPKIGTGLAAPTAPAGAAAPSDDDGDELGMSAGAQPTNLPAATPLAGDETTAPEGAVEPLSIGGAAKAGGMSSRGSAAPSGSDAANSVGLEGGTGLYKRRFSSPAAQKLYQDYFTRTFGGSA